CLAVPPVRASSLSPHLRPSRGIY
ncbi:ribonucleases p mrp protein subunit pop1, partial [Nannochloropsis oceanica]